MNDPFSNKGYRVLTGTDPFDLSETPIGGITTMEDTVISAITHPASLDGVAYNGDSAALPDVTLPAGVFVPIPATAITLASGSAIGWLI